MPHLRTSARREPGALYQEAAEKLSIPSFALPTFLGYSPDYGGCLRLHTRDPATHETSYVDWIPGLTEDASVEGWPSNCDRRNQNRYQDCGDECANHTPRICGHPQHPAIPLGLAELRPERDGPSVMVEGITDWVTAAWYWPSRNIIGTLGAGGVWDAVNRLANNGLDLSRLVLLTDDDEPRRVGTPSQSDAEKTHMVGRKNRGRISSHSGVHRVLKSNPEVAALIVSGSECGYDVSDVWRCEGDEGMRSLASAIREAHPGQLEDHRCIAQITSTATAPPMSDAF